MRSMLALIMMSACVNSVAQGPADRSPPAREDFEVDADKDGVPDGWYNIRDAGLAAGGHDDPTCLRFVSPKRGRPSRASRAFGVDGKTVEALWIGLWVKLADIRSGERAGEDCGLMIDFLGDGLAELARGNMGPWGPDLGTGWVHVSRRISVPEGTHDAIMTLGLLGAAGTLEVDGLTIQTVPRGGAPSTTDLVVNGGLERADPAPIGWTLENGARRVMGGDGSDAALELAASGSKALVPIGGDLDGVAGLKLSIRAKGASLRGAGAQAQVYFLDADGQPLAGADAQARAYRWTGTFGWKTEAADISVPRSARRAVLQVDKHDPTGSIRLDNFSATSTAAPDRPWTPDHVATDVAGWRPFAPSTEILADSPLDASSLVPRPAGKEGYVVARGGRLHFERGGRARFFGVVLLPPLAFAEETKADALAERLARSGVNLARFADLDMPLGPGKSLYEDSRDDTAALDPASLARFDHLVAALKSRGIYVALDLQSARRYRDLDRVAGGDKLPAGGGPAIGFDPSARDLVRSTAELLLSHVNPETKLALRDEPALAWLTIAGESSLFDLVDEPDLLPAASAEVLKGISRGSSFGAGRRLWLATESAQWTAMAADLRKLGLRVPLAGGSHWRREPSEFVTTLTAPGLDFIDDRLYWSPPTWGDAARRSMLRDTQGGIAAAASKKRRLDRPYVVGQWCGRTQGAWAFPFEGADLVLVAATAAAEDWDGLARRGIFQTPEAWGASAAGTGGLEDIFRIPESLNGNPPVFAMLPHAASIYAHGRDADKGSSRSVRPKGLPGWDQRSGRLAVDTPHTQGVVGWPGARAANLQNLTIRVESPFASVMASSLGTEPIASARRLLVTAIGRAEPSGLSYVDPGRHDVADPGHAPMLVEPTRASITWRRAGKLRAYALDNDGRRLAEVPLEAVKDGATLKVVDGSAVHHELIAE